MQGRRMGETDADRREKGDSADLDSLRTTYCRIDGGWTITKTSELNHLSARVMLVAEVFPIRRCGGVE